MRTTDPIFLSLMNLSILAHVVLGSTTTGSFTITSETFISDNTQKKNGEMNLPFYALTM